MVAVRGDKYYHPTTMCPRTSITCMWKKGFIGDIVPTENSVFYYEIRSRRREECARLHDNIYSVVSRSPVSAMHLLRNIAQDFLPFRETKCNVSLHARFFACMYACLYTHTIYMRRNHDIPFKICRSLFALFVLSSSLRMKYLWYFYLAYDYAESKETRGIHTTRLSFRGL